MQNPDNLRVTGEARRLAILVYRSTGDFPSAERFGLTAQMRRAAVSIGSNIAEGCGRFGNRELLRFLDIAFGSLCELEFQTQIATELEFLGPDHRGPLLEKLGHVRRMLARLIKTHRSRAHPTG
jgi:four helix bundle protein